MAGLCPTFCCRPTQEMKGQFLFPLRLLLWMCLHLQRPASGLGRPSTPGCPSTSSSRLLDVSCGFKEMPSWPEVFTFRRRVCEGPECFPKAALQLPFLSSFPLGDFCVPGLSLATVGMGHVQLPTERSHVEAHCLWGVWSCRSPQCHTSRNGRACLFTPAFVGAI